MFRSRIQLQGRYYIESDLILLGTQVTIELGHVDKICTTTVCIANIFLLYNISKDASCRKKVKNHNDRDLWKFPNNCVPPRCKNSIYLFSLSKST